jgi:transcriptional regulator with XRE-family HTH domain
MLVGRQIRAARGLLGWTAQELANRAGVGLSTVLRAERAGGVPRMHTASLDAIQLVLEQAGIVFIPANNGGPGVRLRRST